MSVYCQNISPIRNDHSAIFREIDASAFDLVILIELFKETDCTLQEARKHCNQLKHFFKNLHLYAHNVALFIQKGRHFQLNGNTDFLVQFKTHNLTFSVGWISTKFKECKVPNAEHHISSFIKSEEASAKQNPIQFIVGDFNMHINYDPESGNVVNIASENVSWKQKWLYPCTRVVVSVFRKWYYNPKKCSNFRLE